MDPTKPFLPKVENQLKLKGCIYRDSMPPSYFYPKATQKQVRSKYLIASIPQLRLLTCNLAHISASRGPT